MMAAGEIPSITVGTCGQAHRVHEDDFARYLDLKTLVVLPRAYRRIVEAQNIVRAYIKPGDDPVELTKGLLSLLAALFDLAGYYTDGATVGGLRDQQTRCSDLLKHALFYGRTVLTQNDVLAIRTAIEAHL